MGGETGQGSLAPTRCGPERVAHGRTFIIEVELQPSLHLMRNADGSVNFHNPAVVRVLALATRLLVADRLLIAAWQRLHRV